MCSFLSRRLLSLCANTFSKCFAVYWWNLTSKHLDRIYRQCLSSSSISQLAALAGIRSNIWNGNSLLHGFEYTRQYTKNLRLQRIMWAISWLRTYGLYENWTTIHTGQLKTASVWGNSHHFWALRKTNAWQRESYKSLIGFGMRRLSIQTIKGVCYYENIVLTSYSPNDCYHDDNIKQNGG